MLLFFYTQLPYMLDLHLFLGRPVKIATGASKEGLFHSFVTYVFKCCFLFGFLFISEVYI